MRQKERMMDMEIDERKYNKRSVESVTHSGNCVRVTEFCVLGYVTVRLLKPVSRIAWKIALSQYTMLCKKCTNIYKINKTKANECNHSLDLYLFVHILHNHYVLG